MVCKCSFPTQFFLVGNVNFFPQVVSHTTALLQNWGEGGKNQWHFFLENVIMKQIVCRGKKYSTRACLQVWQSAGRLGTHPYFSASVVPRLAFWSSHPETWAVLFSLWIPARPCWKCWTINGYRKEIPLWETTSGIARCLISCDCRSPPATSIQVW